MMSFTRLLFEKLWTSSEDFPTLEESEMKVREDFQYHPDAIKNFINDVLLAELESKNGASHIGTTSGKNLQSELEALGKEIQDVANGANITVTGCQVSAVPLSAADWTLSGGVYTNRVPASSHKLETGDFGYTIHRIVGGVSVSNTWDALCTDAVYDAATGDIILKAESAYDGVIVIYG